MGSGFNCFFYIIARYKKNKSANWYKLLKNLSTGALSGGISAGFNLFSPVAYYVSNLAGNPVGNATSSFVGTAASRLTTNTLNLLWSARKKRANNTNTLAEITSGVVTSGTGSMAGYLVGAKADELLNSLGAEFVKTTLGENAQIFIKKFFADKTQHVVKVVNKAVVGAASSATNQVVANTMQGISQKDPRKRREISQDLVSASLWGGMISGGIACVEEIKAYQVWKLKDETQQKYQQSKKAYKEAIEKETQDEETIKSLRQKLGKSRQEIAGQQLKLTVLEASLNNKQQSEQQVREQIDKTKKAISQEQEKVKALSSELSAKEQAAQATG